MTNSLNGKSYQIFRRTWAGCSPLGGLFLWRTKKRNYKIQSEAAIPELKVFKFSDQALVTQENSWEIMRNLFERFTSS